MKVIHVMPSNEAEEHEPTGNCKCKPKDFGTNGKVFFHNSYNGQEYFTIKEGQKKWAKQEFVAIGYPETRKRR